MRKLGTPKSPKKALRVTKPGRTSQERFVQAMMRKTRKGK